MKGVDNEGNNGDREGQVGVEDVEGHDNDGDREGQDNDGDMEGQVGVEDHEGDKDGQAGVEDLSISSPRESLEGSNTGYF